MDAISLSIAFQKLGAVFTIGERTMLIRQLDKDRTGQISFGAPLFLLPDRLPERNPF